MHLKLKNFDKYSAALAALTANGLTPRELYDMDRAAKLLNGTNLMSAPNYIVALEHISQALEDDEDMDFLRTAERIYSQYEVADPNLPLYRKEFPFCLPLPAFDILIEEGWNDVSDSKRPYPAVDNRKFRLLYRSDVTDVYHLYQHTPHGLALVLSTSDFAVVLKAVRPAKD